MDVSVIIPTYNRLWSLPKAVESCRNTGCKTEIIVVDDGSTDGTSAWLKNQDNLIVISHENWGKCWAANLGFVHASGKYIKFLDSDDKIDVGSIDDQFILAEQGDADIVVSGYKVIDQNDNVLREQAWINCDDFIAQQLGECDSSHYSSYLFKREFIKDVPHRPDYAFRDDRMFVLEAALKNPKVVIHDGFALLHRKHSEERLQFNIGMRQVVQNFQHFNIYKKIIDTLRIRGNLTERRKKAAVPTLWHLSQWIAKHNIDEAEIVLNLIKQMDPTFSFDASNSRSVLYRKLGFRKTEQLLKIRRMIKYGLQ